MSTCLIIRAKEDAQKTAKTLESKGFKTIIEPIFSVKKLEIGVVDKNPRALIITSSNACRAIVNCGFALDVKIFAVGRQSAQELVESGYSNIAYSAENSAASLKNLIIESLLLRDGDGVEDNKIEQNNNAKRGDKILYFCGDTITLDFQLELEPLGLSVVKVPAYKIKWHDNFSAEFLQKISREPIDFILFYSQNSLKNFYRLAKNNNLLEYFGGSRLLCLSDKIVETAKKFGFKKVDDFKILNRDQ